MCATCCSIRLFIFPVLCVFSLIILKLYADGFQSSSICLWSDVICCDHVDSIVIVTIVRTANLKLYLTNICYLWILATS